MFVCACEIISSCFFLVLVDFELKALHLLVRASITCATHQAFFALAILDTILHSCLGQPHTTIILYSSNIAGIIDLNSHTQLICWDGELLIFGPF
jgi:hypothetical protein